MKSKMKVLFVTSEHPKFLFGGLGTFTREYVAELRKYCEVYCVYFHLRGGNVPLPDETIDLVVEPDLVFDAFAPDARILEVASSFRAKLDNLIISFKPDVIHCNDRQTFLPFRFDKNVFYSSHLIYTDLLSTNCLDDLYFQEIKVERCALERSSVVGVYSKFASKSVFKLSGGLSSPVILPLGLSKEFVEPKNKSIVYKNNKKNELKNDGTEFRIAESFEESFPKLRVCYFGRFENVQKGVNDFIHAVNILGPYFKNKYNVEYSLYGRGSLEVGIDLSLFKNIKFLQGQELINAYKSADIVVMPSRYEPFGLTGLEAMALGCLLLVPSGLGMDMYAKPNWNCLEIPHNPNGISEVLYKAVVDFSKYKFLIENGIATAKKWTWQRCVKAHMYFYNLIRKKRISQLSSAYRLEWIDMLNSYEGVSDVEKVHCYEQEKIGIFSLLHKYSDKRVLVVSGVFESGGINLPINVTHISVLNENADGVYVRPECLPFDDKEFDVVVASGSWETVIEPCGALVEFQRVSKEKVVILYHEGYPYYWQQIQMEDNNDWQNITSSEWNCYIEDNFIYDNSDRFKLIEYNKSEAV